jgi:glutamyl-tRNA reductase
MTFYAFGLNYETASVETTEAFALDADAQRRLYGLLQLGDEAEVILVSTCNRTEVYLYGSREDARTVMTALAAHAGRAWPEEQAFFLDDEAAVRHVLQVTSGLRSMVLGDGQILAQVKNAYQRAVDAGAVHSLMHRLMHTAFRAAKRVASETDVSSGAASVSTAAVAMAEDHFASDGRPPSETPLSGAHVLLVGAGKMGRLALNALDDSAPASVVVTNRSPDRASEVAGRHGADTVPWEDRHCAAARADVVIVATGADEPVITADALPAGRDGESATLLVDIAMPHNVALDVASLDGYDVYNLDDLKAWTERVREERTTEVPVAEDICEEVLGDFVTWVFHQQALQPAIQAIRDTFDTIREQEVDRHAHRTDMDREEVDRLTQSIMQKLLAVPIVKLKNVDPDSVDFVRGIKLLHALFSRPESSDDGGRSLRPRDEDDRPSLSDAPAACPFGTHDPDQDEAESDRVRDALKVPEQE